MKPLISALWRKTPPHDLIKRMDDCLRNALEQRGRPSPIMVFFRADDIAVPGEGFDRLAALFIKHETPLNPAVVPAWLTLPRWRKLREKGAPAGHPWCWHQHGWRHINHESTGKKQEFGPSRPRHLLREDLIRGRNRLEKLMGSDFTPIFTPPWNRCSPETLEELAVLGYAAVSRGSGAKTPLPGNLIDFNIQVDLHTRKEANTADAWQNLFHELGQALLQDRCGIMLHHQRMNNAAFIFLEMLLHLFKTTREIQVVNFKSLFS